MKIIDSAQRIAEIREKIAKSGYNHDFAHEDIEFLLYELNKANRWKNAPTPDTGRALEGDNSVGMPPEIGMWTEAVAFCELMERQRNQALSDLAKLKAGIGKIKWELANLRQL